MNSGKIVAVFDSCFSESHQTILLGGADEPLYQPSAAPNLKNRVYFRSDYSSSALHEVAHWCLAGSARRTLVDYGYWYEHDRDAEKQRLFERSELRPQALEWIFSVAAGCDFQVSVDNFDDHLVNRSDFTEEVRLVVLAMVQTGLPKRASRFASELASSSGVHDFLNPSYYSQLEGAA